MPASDARLTPCDAAAKPLRQGRMLWLQCPCAATTTWQHLQLDRLRSAGAWAHDQCSGEALGTVIAVVAMPQIGACIHARVHVSAWVRDTSRYGAVAAAAPHAGACTALQRNTACAQHTQQAGALTGRLLHNPAGGGAVPRKNGALGHVARAVVPAGSGVRQWYHRYGDGVGVRPSPAVWRACREGGRRTGSCRTVFVQQRGR